jgi:formylglycine-generating enzyme required for sulfatase activity
VDGRIRALQHAIATDPGDAEARSRLRALLRRVANLGDRLAWNQADSSSQDLVIEAVAYQLQPRFAYVETARYEAGGAAHRIAAFRHEASGARLHLIPGGRYERGGRREPLRMNELPRAEVLTRPFLLGQTPLLQSEWDRLPGRDARRFRGAELPIDGVAWEDARTWLRGAGLRLPSEAEWEFACRAGTQTAYFWGDDPDPTYAWFGSGGATWETQPPELHAAYPNAFGLIDVAGNLAEWCEDHYVGSYHGAPCDGSPRREGKGDLRVVRGGDTYNSSSHCRSASRNLASREVQAGGIGLRVAASLDW